MYEYSRYITIGQYLPVQSTVHRLDPRVKLLSFLCLTVTSSIVRTWPGHAVLVLWCLVLFLLARIPMRYALSGLIPALPFIAFMLIIQLFVIKPLPGEQPLLFIWRIAIYFSSLHLSVVATCRFVEVVFLVSTYTLTTRLPDITHSVERLLRPLRTLSVPVHEIALILTIALRFVPTLAEEAERLVKAQVSRGAEFATAKWWQFVKRARGVIPLMVPLFLAALQRAEDLATAMEARAYVPGAKRTSYAEFEAGGLDVAKFAACLAVCAFAIWL